MRFLDSRRALGDLDALIAHDVLDREFAADGLKVAADRADLRAVKVAVLDLGDLVLADADALRELCLGESTLNLLPRPRG